MKYLIKSNYEYEIEAKDEDEAMMKWCETIEDELNSENDNLVSKFMDSLKVIKI